MGGDVQELPRTMVGVRIIKSTLWWLGLILGTLSIVILIKHSYDYGFVAPLQVILDYYEHATEAIIGWARPWLESMLQVLGRWVGWDIHLRPLWKHAFVVTFLTNAAFARALNTEGDLGLRATGLVLCMGPLLFWLLDAISGDLLRGAPIAEALVRSLLSLTTGGMLWATATYFSCVWLVGHLLSLVLRRVGYMKRAIVDLVLGAVVALGFALIIGALQTDHTGYVVVSRDADLRPLFAVLFLGGLLVGSLLLILEGAGRLAREQRRAAQQVSGFWNRLTTNREALAAFSLFSAFAGATIFMFLNAGLKLAGL